MSTAVAQQLSQFALDVADGLARPGQKRLPPVYFYDDLGSALFEAITLLPEYGVTRADERVLQRLSPELVGRTGPLSMVAELGSGSGKKTRAVLGAVLERQHAITYCPIDVSSAALEQCRRDLSSIADVHPVCSTWAEGLAIATQLPRSTEPMLLLFLGSSIGNLSRTEMPGFFRSLHNQLRPGDFFLLGADLVKDRGRMLAAYNDDTLVTAAFNLNLLARMNRELGANFDLRSFHHEARWDEAERRIEMHLVSDRRQIVTLQALDSTYQFGEGESIWTESSHKFTLDELGAYARDAGFAPVRAWVDEDWPFAEVLWQVCS